jgi:hypothetical protein
MRHLGASSKGAEVENAKLQNAKLDIENNSFKL